MSEGASTDAAGPGGATPGDVAQPVTPSRRTLPPETVRGEAPRSAASVVLARTETEPVARRVGARAELAALEARWRAAEGDPDRELEHAVPFARALAQRGIELDLAIRVARRALLLGADRSLGDELAAWLAAIGEWGHAAAALRDLAETHTGAEAARTWTRVAVLHGRAGDSLQAAAALDEAASRDPRDPLALELLGALAGWSEAVPAERAADAYLEAATRRETSGDRAQGFEDVLRAFEMAPHHPPAAERLAGALVARGRAGAADAVLGEHALVARDQSVHRRRIDAALEIPDVARALGASFDAELDRDLGAAIQWAEGTMEAGSFERVLDAAALHDLLVARLCCTAALRTGADRAVLLVAAGRVLAGPLASAERAVEAWLAALAADPASDAARGALRAAAASSHDQTPWIEALIRAARLAGDAGAQARRELAVLAEQRLNDPSLALWALRGLLGAGDDDPALRDSAARLAPRARLQDEALARAEADLVGATGPARVDVLRRLVTILRGRPDEGARALAVLRELMDAVPEERTWAVQIERLLVREGRRDELVALQRRLAEAAPGRRERENAYLALAAIAAEADGPAAALPALEPLLAESSGNVAAWCAAYSYAAAAHDDAGRARALTRLAPPLPPPLRAVLLAVAADAWRAAGDLEAARDAALAACRADPSLTRPIATAARVALVDRAGPGRIALLERSMAVVVPRAVTCGELALAYAEQGDATLSLAWTQRWLALRPGDPRANAELLGRVMAAGDAGRVADAVGWILSAAQPQLAAVPTLGAALELVADADPARAAGVARRLLDVVGPRAEMVRDVIRRLAERVGERGLYIACLERAAASAGSELRASLLMELAAARRAAGDADGASRALLRALASGASPEDVLSAVDGMPAPRTTDGEVSLARARGEALAALPGAEPAGVARALREAGAAVFDLAGDPRGAQELWERAATIEGERGLLFLARDLAAFAGAVEAVRLLTELSERGSDEFPRARVLGVAALTAFEAGLSSEAADLGLRALELDPARADLLAIIERSVDGDVERLETAYTIIANVALGIYGERAIHYRAARQLERRGDTLRALNHALAAFEAVPAEGVAFVLATRLAAQISRETELVEAVKRVAAATRGGEARARWLRRAATLVGNDLEGALQRVDVLVRALGVAPDGDTLRALGQAVSTVLGLDAALRPELLQRFRELCDTLLARIDGPEGARGAIAAARVALDPFDAVDLALLALRRAVDADADVDEYAELLREVPRLAADVEGSRALVARSLELAKPKWANVGIALTRFSCELARAVDEPVTRARLLVLAARRNTDDRALAAEAEIAARESRDPELLAEVLDAVPPRERARALLDLASAAERSGEVGQAVAALERAIALEGVEESDRRRAVRALSELYGRAGRRDALEILLATEVDRHASSLEDRVAAGRDLAALQATRGHPERALGLLERLSEEAPDDEGLLADRVELARQAGDHVARATAVGRLADLARDPAQRLALLRDLAPLLEEIRDYAAAYQRWADLLEIEPNDIAALAALEREAEQRGDFERVVGILARRAGLSSMVDDVRRIRLRRAMVLEQRLGRADEARAELEALIASTGDNLSVLRVLADLHQRLGAPLRAAPLWLRASAIARDRSEAAELSHRACEAYLAGDDVEGARRVLEALETWSDSGRVAELRVEIERRSENPTGLGSALEDLALASMKPPEDRAALLVEAARAAVASGDLAAALARVERAARIAPGLPEAALGRHELEYRLHGAGDPTRARAAIEHLASLSDALDEDQRELRAFLVAEAHETLGDPGAAFGELERTRFELGSRPLVALGLAERYVATGAHEKALPLFDAALAGDLRGLRQRGRVALMAVTVARHLDRTEQAAAWLEPALADADTRPEALALEAELRAAEARRSLPAPAERVSLKPIAPREPVADDEQPPPAVGDRLDLRREPETRSSAAPARRSSAPPPRLPSERPIPRQDPSEVPPPSAPRRASEPPARAVAATEATLIDALNKGSIAAGRELVQRLENQSARAHDLIEICRRVAALVPGEPWALHKLWEAALADRDVTYARAVAHTLAVFDPSVESAEAPPLLDVEEQVDAVRTLLFREVDTTALEALALVWEGAERVFRRDPSTYGVTGLERVPLGAATPVGRVITGASRLLGTLRTPVFQRRSTGAVTVSVALLSPPALILSGDPRKETPALRYHVGAMLAATMPEHALLYGSPESQAESVLRGLALAFGPPQREKKNLVAAATIAEVLWQSVPTRSQRRLRALCDPERLDYEVALGAARRVVRRAGLLVSGDLAVALREAAADEGISLPALGDARELAALAAASPALTDLVRFAISREYAQTRWRVVTRPGRPGAGGRSSA